MVQQKKQHHLLIAIFLPGDDKPHSFNGISGISSLGNNSRINPNICQFLQVATGLKHFDRHREVDQVNVACQQLLSSLYDIVDLGQHK